MTKLLGVIGDPIAHSLSPIIHNGWYRDLGIGATYEAMQVAEGELPGALSTLARKGAVGVNITLPHKLAAREISASSSETVERIGAANTLTCKPDGSWCADNTDVPGFTTALTQLLNGQKLSGLKAILLGAGGSARAVIHALGLAGADVICLNRTESKALDLVHEFGSKNSVAGSIDQYTEYKDSADVVINTTSAGYSADPLNPGLGNGRLFYDISYGQAANRQLQVASANGWKRADGISMLVAQAAESFEIWFGIRPDIEKAELRCRNALKAIV